MLELLEFFFPYIVGLGKDCLPREAKRILEKGFETLLKEIIIDYYKLISKDRVLSIDQEPGSLTLLLEPGIVSPGPTTITKDQAIKKTQEVVIAVAKILSYLPSTIVSDPKRVLVALEEQRVFLLTVAEDSYPYFHPAAVLTAIGLQIQTLLLSASKEFSNEKTKVGKILLSIKMLVEESDLVMGTDILDDYYKDTFPVKFDFDKPAIDKLNRLGILKSTT